MEKQPPPSWGRFFLLFSSCLDTPGLKFSIFSRFTFAVLLHKLTFAVLSQNCGMVTTVELKTN